MSIPVISSRDITYLQMGRMAMPASTNIIFYFVFIGEVKTSFIYWCIFKIRITIRLKSTVSSHSESYLLGYNTRNADNCPRFSIRNNMICQIQERIQENISNDHIIFLCSRDDSSSVTALLFHHFIFSSIQGGAGFSRN